MCLSIMNIYRLAVKVKYDYTCVECLLANSLHPCLQAGPGLQFSMSRVKNCMQKLEHEMLQLSFISQIVEIPCTI
jgi:hypothetical protein